MTKKVTGVFGTWSAIAPWMPSRWPRNLATVSAVKKDSVMPNGMGFAQARIKAIRAWARLFALFAIALFVLTSLGMRLLLCGGPQVSQLLRRVASRRRARCELSLIAAVIALVQQDRRLFRALSISHQAQFGSDFSKCVLTSGRPRKPPALHLPRCSARSEWCRDPPGPTTFGL